MSKSYRSRGLQLRARGWHVVKFLSCLLVVSSAVPSLGNRALGQQQEPLPLPPSVLETAPPAAQQGFEQQDYEQLEELARGPVHEAFAEQVSYDPIPGIIVEKQPPEPIAELPPEYKPEGDGYVFISGYWFWDDSREDFIWVSGGYRQLPPDTVWVNGYWHQVDGGWQRVSGFYSLAEANNVAYYRSPPTSLENGPIGPAPSQDHMWSPGYWAPYEGEFVWRPGYWRVCRPDWVWIPHYWRWTPRGCVLVGGYWDFPWETRGHCFAPVYFHRPVYLNVGWNYRPRIVLRNIGVQLHWFVRPYDCHYYFGDWYGVDYARRGFIPGFEFHLRSRGIGYDPCFAYNQWSYGRRGLDYLNVSIQWNRYFNDHHDARPPRQFVVQNNVIQNIRNTTINNINIDNSVINQTAIAESIGDVAGRGDRAGWRRMERGDLEQVEQMVQRSRQTQRERAQAESATERLAAVRNASADSTTIRQLEQLSREQQSAARQARQQATELVTRRMNGDTDSRATGRSSRAAGQSVTNDRELVKQLDRQLPQVAISDATTARERRSGQANAAPNGRSIELNPPRSNTRSGINSQTSDRSAEGSRGAGWQNSPRNNDGRSLGAQGLGTQGSRAQGLNGEAAERIRQSVRNQDNADNGARSQLPSPTRQSTPRVIETPKRESNAVPNTSRGESGRGSGWQDRRGQTQSLPQSDLNLPRIDRSELERRAAGQSRNQGATVLPQTRIPQSGNPNIEGRRSAQQSQQSQPQVRQPSVQPRSQPQIQRETPPVTSRTAQRQSQPPRIQPESRGNNAIQRSNSSGSSESSRQPRSGWNQQRSSNAAGGGASESRQINRQQSAGGGKPAESPRSNSGSRSGGGGNPRGGRGK